jgi:hypothetical protein
MKVSLLALIAGCWRTPPREQVAALPPSGVFELGEITVLKHGDEVAIELHADGTTELWGQPGPTVRSDGTVVFDDETVFAVGADGKVRFPDDRNSYGVIVTANEIDDVVHVALEADGTIHDEKTGKVIERVVGATTPAKRRTALALILASIHGCCHSRADLYLSELARAAERAYAQGGSYPIGRSRTLPVNHVSRTGCCGEKSTSVVDNKCPVSTEWKTDVVWAALGFEIAEPARYRLTYESSDGKSFVATAVGDLDCDGTEATYTLTGGVTAQGDPTTNVISPRGRAR